MEIIIDEKAKKFIEKKGESSIMAWLDGCSSWGPSEPQPSVEVGKPEDEEEYDKYSVSDIDVYVKKDVEAKNNKLNIKHSKILWNERIFVEGMLF